MIKKIDIKNRYVAKQVLELQMASYKVEAEIINYSEIPPLKDTVESLIGCGEIFYGYFNNDVIKGIISYKIENNILDIHRVAIHPDNFRKGIAGNLLNFIESVEGSFVKIEVCTGKKNTPAKNLYRRTGYNEVMDIFVNSELVLTKFEKLLHG